MYKQCMKSALYPLPTKTRSLKKKKKKKKRLETPETKTQGR